MKRTAKKSPRCNVVARDLRTPKYKQRVVPNKRDKRLDEIERRLADLERATDPHRMAGYD